MNRDEFMRKKYSEINELKNLMKVYPADYIDSIISVLEKVTDELIEYLNKEKSKIKEEIIDEYEKEKKKENKYKNTEERKLRTFTIEEVQQADGKDGRPAYIIIEGSVYDVGDCKEWCCGKHYGISSGKDLTNFYKSCHKNEEYILKRLRLIGTLVE